MATRFDHFHVFPALPTELQLQIWKLALPGPQLLEPMSMYWEETVQDKDSKWVWATCNRSISPALLHVSRQAREVALEFYKPTNVWDQSQFPWTRVYVDYSKDIFHFSYSIYLDLLRSFRSLQTPPIQPDETRFFSIVSGSFYSYWSDEENQEVAVNRLQPVLDQFRNLQQLILVIDGRDASFEGPDDLVEPTEQYEDYYQLGGRTLMLERTKLLEKELKKRNADLKVPPLRLKLLINGQEASDRERRWDYSGADCLVCAPGYRGNVLTGDYL